MRELSPTQLKIGRSDMMRSKPKILVVDDDKGMRFILAEILEYEGFVVTTAIDGLQGVEMATKNHFDFIFMDYRMPGIDGMEAVRRIKVVSPDTIVIMVTAFAGDLVERALDEGAYAVLYKPFDLDQLADLLRTTLKSTCVLVIDDEPETRNMVRAILEQRGFRVSEAKDGKQAVAKARKKQHDVILMDGVMPDMEGYDACEKIIEEDPDAKVIFLTAHSAVGWVKQALSDGVFSLLKKPVVTEDMLSLLKSVGKKDAAGSRPLGSHGRAADWGWGKRR